MTFSSIQWVPMRLHINIGLLCLVFLLNSCSVASDELNVKVKGATPRASKVIELTEENFEAEVCGWPIDAEMQQPLSARGCALIERGPYFVEVYADWCSRCVQVAPTWEELAKELDGEIFVGKCYDDRESTTNWLVSVCNLLNQIDGPKQKALLSRLGVQGYPAFFLFRDGQTWEYASSRSLK
eukprot:2499564-Pyramimonas_sp.AAC.1